MARCNDLMKMSFDTQSIILLILIDRSMCCIRYKEFLRVFSTHTLLIQNHHYTLSKSPVQQTHNPKQHYHAFFLGSSSLSSSPSSPLLKRTSASFIRYDVAKSSLSDGK